MIDTLGFFVQNIINSNSEAQNSTKATSHTLSNGPAKKQAEK